MALQEFSSTDALTNQIWAEGTEAEVLQRISYTGLVGERADSIIQLRKGTSSRPGDTERIALRLQMDSAPKSSEDVVEDNELSMQFKYQDFTIDEVVEAVSFRNIMDRQRINFDMRDEARAGLADLLANAWDTSMFNQLAGFAPSTAVAKTFRGNNTVTAPDSDHHIFSEDGGASTTYNSDDDLNSTDVFSLELIDIAKERAKLLTPPMRMGRVKGYDLPLFVCFVHPTHVTELRTNSTGQWREIMNAALQAGLINKNPLITGALGIYNETLLIESPRVPMGISAAGALVSTVRRAVFCGAQAAFMGTGRFAGTPTNYRWVEKYKDFDRQYAVMAGFLGGIKRSIFNSKSYGSMVISAYGSAQ